MKRFLCMFVAVCAFLAASAQHPMVTLSHNGELSFFTNLTAFEAAVDSAKNGDTIYLSEGHFTLSRGKITIKKPLNIIGNGYGSHLLGDLTIQIPSASKVSMTAPLFDGVRIDYLTFTESPLDEVEICRCWIKKLGSGATAAKNVTFDKCYIQNSQFNGNGTVLVTNSKIIGLNSSDDWMENITAINCNITQAHTYPRTMISCIFKLHSTTGQPNVVGGTHSIIKSVLDFNPTSTNVYKNDCYYYSDDSVPLLDENLECPLDLTELGYLGQDDTVVGIHGGEYPFSENPSVPTVDTANSSVEYDAEENKLKVSITVSAD